MSKIKVNSIEAATGSTITIPSGQTLDISSTTLTLPSTVVTTTGTQTLTNKTIGVSQLSGTLPVANGGTGLTTLGSASQVLRVNSGATALEFATPAVATSDFVLLATTNQTSAVASVAFDDFTDTYHSFKIHFSNVIPVTNGVLFEGRVRRSNADVTSSNYKSLATGAEIETGSVSNDSQTGGLFNSDRIRLQTGNQLGNTTSYGGISGFITLHNARATTNYKMGTGMAVYNRSDDAVWLRNEIGFVDFSGTGALSGFIFFMSSGNIASGNFKLYGIK
jgi:hypothetical protein